MHTVKLQLEDKLYVNILSRGIDIQERFKTFLLGVVDDGYPIITSEEAVKRVQKAVREVENGEADLLGQDEQDNEMNAFMKTL